MKIMDILFRGYRPKKARDNTYPKKKYIDGKYWISWHAVDQMNFREVSKGKVHYNLHTKPLKIDGIKYDKLGRPSYNRHSYNKVTTSINPFTRVVTTVHPITTKRFNKMLKNRRKRK